MRKVTFLVAVFLIGITAQAFNNNQKNVVINTGTTHHYSPKTSVSFEEGGVLFTVNKQGAFDFEFYKSRPYSRYKRRGNNHNIVYRTNGRRGHTRKNRRVYRPQIIRDCYGEIVQIGRTPLTYKKNGKVRTIGDVDLYYHKGRLIQVGGMEIEYNRFGEIRNIYGSIHNYENHVWHDDCKLRIKDANHTRPRNGRHG